MTVLLQAQGISHGGKDIDVEPRNKEGDRWAGDNKKNRSGGAGLCDKPPSRYRTRHPSAQKDKAEMGFP
jgi:hypothetical protein